MAGNEHDLGRIIEQVQSLRQLQGTAEQTEAEYRTTIINHMNGLLAICNEPDIRNIVGNPQASITISPVSMSDSTSIFGPIPDWALQKGSLNHNEIQ